MSRAISILAFIIVIAAAVFAAVVFVRGRTPSEASGSSGTAAASPAAASPAPDAPETAYWTCSMHPSVRQAQPGLCPICKMELVPVLASDLSGGMITVDEGRRQVIGVKLGKTEMVELTRELRAAAVVAIDETRLTEVTVRVGGWIRTLAADAPGKRFAKGDELFTLYSPELIAAQSEYVAGRAADRDGALTHAARTRLARLGMADAGVAALEAAGAPLEQVSIASPADGVVLEKTVVAGARVESGTRVLRLADLSRVWVEAAIHEQDLGLVAVGAQVAIELPAPGAVATEGTVAFVYPYVDDATRTGRVRIEVANADGALKPGMYATCVIRIPLGRRLTVPEDAVVYAGEHRVVFRDLGGGKLKPVDVTTGARAQGRIEILGGLADGDAIVVSGVFLLASESRIKSGTSQW